MEHYKNEINKLFPEMVSWRRQLHQNPELSFHEKKTSLFVYSKLLEWGIDAKHGVGGYGVIGNIQGARPGPTVALRADMDALAIQDEKDCEYASKVSGVMHACGHDAHTSTLLAIAKILSEGRSELDGNVRLIFQPGEEIYPGGAQSMIEQGVLKDVNVIYGVHLWSSIPYGVVASREGPLMAAVDDFDIEIRGRGGHAGYPHESVDSIVVGAHLMINLQSIISRHVDPIQPCVISVGSFHGGSNSFNVIAEKCVLKGTVRSFDNEIRIKIQKDIERVTADTCSMFGASYNLKYIDGYPFLNNHEIEIIRFKEAAIPLFGEDAVKIASPSMAAEDFSYYLQNVPGCFIFVGANKDSTQPIIPHHHPRFDIEEKSMKHAAELLIHMTLNYMSAALTKS